MKRNYQDIRDYSDSVSFFVGPEVEHTPAFGMQTLFVVGIQDPKEIIFTAEEHQVEHIYFGANQSFPLIDTNDYKKWSPWESMIEHLLDKEYYCTLDIPVTCVEGLLESGLCENHRFIPMISVKLPYIQQLGYNATIKLDDQDFAATNPGVWCHSLHSLMKRDMIFTAWSKYTKDKVIK
jgi:hypothetical protein